MCDSVPHCSSTVGGKPVFTWEEVVANVDAGLRLRSKVRGKIRNQWGIGEGRDRKGGGGGVLIGSTQEQIVCYS